MAHAPPVVPAPLRSQLLAEDATMREIVEEFVRGLAIRLAELRAALARRDWETLALLAHRLKGAGGSYGYPDVSLVAAQIEAAARCHSTEGFESLLTQLEGLRAAAQAGLAE